MAAGRIRTIKPELLTDGSSGRLSSEAWRLFVSMLLLADDHGLLPGDPDMLHGSVFWGRPLANGRAGIESLVQELDTAGMVTPYSVRGALYLRITNWTKHQKVDRPGKPRYPLPPGGDNERSRETLANDRETLATDHDHDHDHDHERYRGALAKWHVEARRIFDLQERLRREVIPDVSGLKATEERLKRIAVILDDGTATVEQCEAVLHVVADEVRRDSNQAQWFNGDTCWRRSNFDRYLGRVSSVKAKAVDPWAAVMDSARRQDT